MADEIPRSRQAKLAAEQALVRIVHHYGERPEFVVLGGLVPDLLCSSSARQHAGTTDIDVQVNLEIECDAVNTARLEHALRNAEFEPDSQQVWRWRFLADGIRAEVKFELLADLDSEANEATINFDDCERLGAVNLRGTKYAAMDVESRIITAKVGNDRRSVEINVTDVAGFLLAKCAAAYSRRKPKDWYDIAFVLLHNDLGGPIQAARAVVDRLGRGALKSSSTALAELTANFADPRSQGPGAYADQFLVDHPDYDQAQARADAVTAVTEFCEALGRA
ncbi:MAG TPA: nucleotidyl transferase AbiEii/AbiGii toxin family protein [Steroidobacteraceae bacterium]|nr:nucleotidyl transferase AbiEii/AbiGii toxin family protein [Steroidobacteraceae bacterium]